jgi:hypothetical protein
VDRAGGEDRADDADAERELTTRDELARDARLLRRRGGIEVAQKLDQLLLRAVRPIDESDDTDEQREQRDQREEQLVCDRAREERAFVIPERGRDGARVADEGPDPCQDAASLFGDGLSGAFDSDFFSVFASVLVSPFVSALVSDFVSLFLSPLVPPSSEPFWAGRLSVLYQPDPLKTIAGVDNKRRGFLPQFGHFSSGSSLYDCTAENTWPQ